MTLCTFEHKETVMVDSLHINIFDMVYVWWQTKRSNVQYCKSFVSVGLGTPLSVLIGTSHLPHAPLMAVIPNQPLPRSLSFHVVANMQGHHASWFYTQNGMLYR